MNHLKILRNPSGNTFIFTVITVAILTLMVGALVEYAGTENLQGRKQNDSTRAFLIANSALQKIKADLNNEALTNSFAYYFKYANPSSERQFPNRCNFFRSTNAAVNGQSIAYGGITYTVPTQVDMGSIGNWPVTCNIVASRGHDDNFTTLYGKGQMIIRVTAQYPNNSEGMSRTITETVQFGTSPSKVFDYAYFINNFGWMYGSTITLNGDVRSNRNFSFQSNPKLNGDVYASLDPTTGTAGVVNGTYVSDSISTWYNRTVSSTMRTRVGNPAISGGANYSPGYKGSSTKYQYQSELTMPYIPTLEGYKQLVADETSFGTGSTFTVADCTSYQGTLIADPVTTDSNGNKIISSSFKDRPYLAFWDSGANSYRQVQIFDNTTSRNTNYTSIKQAGALLISGDSTHPIVINGPVVVMGDVVIKGNYIGQGTIFANRNVHIADNLQALTPPSFPQTDSTPLTTFQTNKTKDLMGLVARGNVILGNYTLASYTTGVAPYNKPPFTAAYSLKQNDVYVDEDLGYYKTTMANGDHGFDGNYTNTDGGVKNNSDGSAATGATNRKFYQSTLADSVFSAFSVADNSTLTKVDGVMYNNHLVSGRIGATIVNGTMVARDEAIVFSGTINFNYDERIHSTHGEDRLKIFLPYELAKPYTITWREGS
jgi:Tfp pilus assembly protein PilX